MQLGSNLVCLPLRCVSVFVFFCCLGFFFVVTFQFLAPCERAAARGSVAFLSMENRWQGRAVMAGWKKGRGGRAKRKRERKEKNKLAHWDPLQRTWSQWECVRVTKVCARLLRCVTVCVFLSAPLALSGVRDDELSLSSAGHDADVQTVALCFSSFNKPLMETPGGLAVSHLLKTNKQTNQVTSWCLMTRACPGGDDETRDFSEKEQGGT